MKSRRRFSRQRLKGRREGRRQGETDGVGNDEEVEREGMEYEEDMDERKKMKMKG